MAKILQQLQWKGQAKLEDNEQDGETRLKIIYVKWGQKTCRQCAEGMEKDCIESQGIQRAVMLGKKKKKKRKNKKKRNNNKKKDYVHE